MAFSDLDWASDANFPAGADSWSATPTRVAPTVGQQAAGAAPEDVLPAQWFNWLFGELVDAGIVVEAAVGDGALQHAYDQSVSLGQASPHIDISADFLRVGAPTPAVPMLVMDEASNNVFFGADVDIYTGKTLTVPAVNKLLITGAGASTTTALTQTAGVGGEIAIAAGVWSPATNATASSGIGADYATDFTSSNASYTRFGKIVTFAMTFVLDATGWATASPYVFHFTPPVASNFASTDEVQGNVTGTSAAGAGIVPANSFLGLNTSTDKILVNFATTGTLDGSYTIDVTGQYQVT